MDLPETTTDRLLAVAQIIEEHPEKWDQGLWRGDCMVPDQAHGLGECGTTACVAGWAVTLTPKHVVLRGDYYGQMGADALGIEYAPLANRLFFSGTSGQRINGWRDATPHMPDILRIIATFPEGERTYENVHEACLDKGIDF